ncbi:response regulator [Caedibacter taeniospiralis]|jgi:two-component system OmpR family response regulator|uniref:response regulator n=1 Tax=Caedibacter taeniospiralis TaxID=28907 RepID=UPI0037C1000D
MTQHIIARPIILIIDDDREIRNLLSKSLTEANYQVITASNTRDATRMIDLQKPSLILLDINLPMENGIEFCKRLQTKHAIPTIMLTASDDDIDRVLSYEVGADHYVTKPFNPKVLLATIKSVLRRTTLKAEASQFEPHHPYLAYFKDWCFNTRERSLVHTNGMSVELTTREFDILHLLIENNGEPLSREMLVQTLYGREYSGFDRNVDMMVMRVRNKIEVDAKNPQIIKTVHGVGYLFSAPVQWQHAKEQEQEQ